MLFLEGTYEERNEAGWFWIAKHVVATTDSERNDWLSFTVIVPDFYETIGMLPLTVTVLANERLIFQERIANHGVFHFDTKKLPSGNVILKINTDKSFVPKETLDLKNNDDRELSIILKDICVMKTQNEANYLTLVKGLRKMKLFYHRFLRRINYLG